MDKVNKKVIPIKLFGFLWHIGTHMVFPFMTIQMLQIGLNLQDVSIVYGITPLVTFLASPLSGCCFCLVKPGSSTKMFPFDDFNSK